MSTDAAITDSIERAAAAVGRVWPLHSFVTANPLAGFEDRPFHEAVRHGERLYGEDGYPAPETLRRALDDGRIDTDRLESRLSANGYAADPPALLEEMADAHSTVTGDTDPTTPMDRVNKLLTKWLPVFLDQGQAHWSMPNREQGFYAAVRTVAPHDRLVPDDCRLTELPPSPEAALEVLLAEYPSRQWANIFESQLAALPGWTGLIKQRITADREWQASHPITLAGYLAVRLAVAEALDAPFSTADETRSDHDGEPRKVGHDTGDSTTEPAGKAESDQKPLPAVWLSAWEATYRAQLTDAVVGASANRSQTDESGRPDAQFVFCIDTRSEPIRRHIESAGNYETRGYAGFFGIPMRHEGYDSGPAVEAYPPILAPEHHIADQPAPERNQVRHNHDHWTATLDAAADIVETLKTNVVTAYSFVESAGAGYGAALAARTLLPGRMYELAGSIDDRVPDPHEFCEPSLDPEASSAGDLPRGLTIEEKIEYAATAFDLMGWDQFARVVVFAGHASSTSNNPFESSLDCGACAGNSGGPSARV
ncbi:MAG: uncharacterized protein conserved in bacteria (DUF2309), partial [uncultured archaeon A07HR60]